MSNVFVESKEIGKLYIDRILFESYYPVLFSCKNEIGAHFICVCCQNNKDGKKWLLGKTDVHNIIKALKNKITIRDLLLNYTSLKISIDTIKGESQLHYNNDDWSNNSIYLPKDDSYLDPDEGEFDEDIEYYRQEQLKRYNGSALFKNVLQKKLETDGTQLEIDSFECFCTDNIDITSEVLKNCREIANIIITNVEPKKVEYEYNRKINNYLELDISDKIQRDKIQIKIAGDDLAIAA